jgi:uncharacterized membrane protein YjjP (DUF1212 family)
LTDRAEHCAALAPVSHNVPRTSTEQAQKGDAAMQDDSKRTMMFAILAIVIFAIVFILIFAGRWFLNAG